MNGGFVGSTVMPAGGMIRDEQIVHRAAAASGRRARARLEGQHVEAHLGAFCSTIRVAALAQDIEQQDRALPSVDPVFLDETEISVSAILDLLRRTRNEHESWKAISPKQHRSDLERAPGWSMRQLFGQLRRPANSPPPAITDAGSRLSIVASDGVLEATGSNDTTGM